MYLNNERNLTKHKKDIMKHTKPLNDKNLITKAFKLLRNKGYFAKQNYYCCTNCGWSAIPEDKADHAVFYHNQNAESFEKDGNIRKKDILYLAWSGNGKEIVEILQSVNFKVVWNGKEETKIGLMHSA